jgi:hypothetical protein
MIVIHIGLRKAGSTAIQAFLSANVEALRNMGVEYPTIGRQQRVDHNNLANEIRGRSQFDAKYGTLADLVEYWKNCDSDTLLLSGETFEESNPGHITALKDMLSVKGDKFKIVMINRELIDLIPSSYSQKVKYGDTADDFDSFFEKRMDHRRISVNKTAKRWGEIFGWDCMCVRELDSRFLTNGDLIDDILAILGLDPSTEAARALSRPGPANVSPGWRVLEALRALYSGEAGLHPEHPLADLSKLSRNDQKMLGVNAIELGERRGWNEDKGLYLTEAQAVRAIETHTQAVRRLNRALPYKLPLPRDLDERDFTPRRFLPDHTHISAERLASFYDKLGTMPLTWRPGVA